MIDKSDIDKLSSLARIAVSPDEKEALSGEIDAILSYVSQIKGASSGAGGEGVLAHTNVLREDTHPHETGIFTEAILKEAPAVKNGFIYVKKILPL